MFKKEYNLEVNTQFITQYLWVKEIVDSCKTIQQLDNSGNLVIIFLEKYRDRVSSVLYHKLCVKLCHHWLDKRNNTYESQN